MKRWVQSGEGDDAVDRRIGLLLRQFPPPPPLGPGPLARVAARLRPARRPRRLPRWALVTAILLGTSGVVYARRDIARAFTDVVERLGLRGRPTASRSIGERRPPAQLPRRPESAPAVVAPVAPSTAAVDLEMPEVAPAAPMAPAPPPRTRSREGDRRSRPAARKAPVRTVAMSPPAPAPVAAAPAPPASEISPTSPSPGPAPTGDSPAAWLDLLPPAPAAPAPRPEAPPPAKATAPPRSHLGAEAQLLARALASLRQDGDAEDALARLDEHRERFPRGLLRDDADLLRVDALLALRRRAEALTLLESLELEGTPRGLELQLVRAELRATRSCRRARPDFQSLLGQTLPDRLAERALRGLAICRLRETGTTAGARSELEAYLSRFPDGPFAAQARARLRAP